MTALSKREIDRALEKIRKAWEDYIVRSCKSLSLKEDFEERYRLALRERRDLSAFLLAEKTAVEELSKKAEEEGQGLFARPERFRTAPVAPPRQGIADRVLEDQRRKIAPYPDLVIHPAAPMEIRKLFGAIAMLAAELWPESRRIILAYGAARGRTRVYALEDRLLRLTARTGTGLPPRAEALIRHLSATPRDADAIELEQKRCLVEAAAFLHEWNDALRDLVATEGLPENTALGLSKSSEFLQNVLADFRLKDLRPTQTRSP